MVSLIANKETAYGSKDLFGFNTQINESLHPTSLFSKPEKPRSVVFIRRRGAFFQYSCPDSIEEN